MEGHEAGMGGGSGSEAARSDAGKAKSGSIGGGREKVTDLRVGLCNFN